MGQMRLTRQTAWTALALALLVASVFIFRRHLPYTGVPSIPKSPPAAIMAMDGVSLVGLGREGKLWALRAAHVEVAQNRTTATITRIADGEVFSGKRVSFRVRAGRAVYDTGSGYLALDGGIHIEGPKQKLAAGGAVWSPVTQLLRSTGPVEYTSEWTKLRAEGLQLDTRNKELSLMRVRGSFAVEEVRDAVVSEVKRGSR